MPSKQKGTKRIRRASATSNSDDSYTSDYKSAKKTGGISQPKRSKRSKGSKSSRSSRQSSTQSNGGSGSNDEAPPPSPRVKQSKKPKEDLDKYCKMCDDGGSLIECENCHFSFCYDENAALADSLEDAPAPRACVSVQKGYTLDRFKMFYCPECLTNYPDLPLDYQINRGYRTTQRRTVNFQVVVLLCYLPDLEKRAKVIYESIRSALGALEIIVEVFYLPLPNTLHKANRASILGSDYPYHLVFIFFTETNPGGGWWMESNAQTDEAQWLAGLVTLYTDIAEKAVTARVFGLCCGLNLTEEKTIPAIVHPFVNSHWDSIMLPTASSLLPEELATIFPELFGQLYYNGVALESAVVRVWSTSLRARAHTDILLIEGLHSHPTVKKYRYGSLSSRPYGVDLPAPWTFCRCAREGIDVKWKRKDGNPKLSHNEFMVRYKTTCGHAHVDLAIFTGDAQIREAAGVQVLVEEYDPQKRIFPLDSSDSICMRPFLGDNKSKGIDHESAWTRYGKLLEAASPEMKEP